MYLTDLWGECSVFVPKYKLRAGNLHDRGGRPEASKIVRILALVEVRHD